MQELLERCCGLDVHKETVVACIMIGNGKQVHKETRTFGTMTEDLRRLLQWIKENNVKHVAMESTGIYWVPIFNILEESSELEISLANARHIKNVPGRKTDMKDAEWICKLLKCGLIEKSFIPEAELRDLRMLLRYRKSLISDLSAKKNRVIKILEAANIKLASVLSDVYSVSGWKIIRAIIDGETNPEVLLQYIQRSVRASRTEILKSLTGTLRHEHIQILKLMIQHIDDLEKLISRIELQLEESTQKYSSNIQLLKTIPGVGNLVATTLVAEMGIDMNQFPSDKHLASWAGLAPSNNESAGKKKVVQ